MRVFSFKRCFHMALFLSVSGACWWGWNFAQNPAAFPIKSVQIQGAWRHTKQSDLQEVLMPEVSRGFFNLNVNRVEKLMLQFPWVQSVSLQRVWPNKLVVTLKEHEPEFIVNQYGMMSVEGVFVPVSVPTMSKHLPELNGPVEKLSDMRQEFIELQAVLKPTQLQISTLTLAARGSWKLKLSNGTELYLGRDDILNRLRQYVRIFPQLVQRKGVEIVSVDLRYRNGAAVKVQPIG